MQKNHYKLSIVIPVYNAEKFLEDCMNSILSQSRSSEVEIILSDDGSMDAGLQLCDSYAEKYENVKALHYENGGASAARNRGIKAATGQYIQFVDSDDTLADEALEQILFALNNEPDLLLINLNRICEGEIVGTTAWKREHLKGGVEQFRKNLIRNIEMTGMPQVTVVKRSFLLEDQIRFVEGIIHEDMEWVPHVIGLAENIEVLETPVYNYVVGREGSVMNATQVQRHIDSLMKVASVLTAAVDINTGTSSSKLLWKRASGLALFMAMQYAALDSERTAVDLGIQIRRNKRLFNAIKYSPRKYFICVALTGNLCKGIKLYMNKWGNTVQGSLQKNSMPKVCIVLVGKLPVPAVMGGAVETLAQALAEQNEIHQRLSLTFLSVETPEAVKQAAQYHHSRFVWFRPYRFWNKVWWRVRTLILKVSKKEICFPYQRQVAARWLKLNQNNYDLFVAESELEMFLKAGIPADKVLYHLHWHGNPTAEKDAAFGTLMPVSMNTGRGWCERVGRDPDTIQVLFNCADIEVFSKRLSSEERDNLRSQLGFQKDAVIVVFSGRLVPAKGARELIKAVNASADKRIGALIIGGTNFAINERSDYLVELHKLVEEGGHKIVFTGFVPNGELWRYYQAADMMCAPSQIAEAAGLVNIEAMAAGLPMIATKVGGVPEYLSPDCGVLVEWDERLVESLTAQIDRLAQSPELRQAMAQAGPEVAKKFSKENNYQRFVEIINDVNENLGRV